MIRKVRVDYNRRHSPGTITIICSAKGRIIYDRNQTNHKLRDKQIKKVPRQRGNADEAEALGKSTS